jgi:hypothetical protein
MTTYFGESDSYYENGYFPEDEEWEDDYDEEGGQAGWANEEVD